MDFNFVKVKNFAMAMFVSAACLLSAVVCRSAEKYLGEIGEVKGTVEILKDGETEWVPVVEEMPVQMKERIKTSGGSSCNLELDDGSIVYVGENTETSVEMLDVTGDKHESKISLWFGKLIANIKKSKQTKMSVRTPTAICAVRGTEFAVEATADESSVGVFDGQVGVIAADAAEGEKEVSVDPDQETSVLKGEMPLPPSRLSEVMMKHKERNEQLRERVKLVRERLSKTPLKDRIKKRNAALKKFKGLREKRIKQMKKLKGQRDKLKGRTIGGAGGGGRK